MNTSLRLVLSNVSVSRGDRILFDGLTFSLDSGAAMIVTGPNGVGKTTLLRAIAGFIRPTAGAIELAGATEEIALPQAAHFVGHRDGLRGALSVAENLAFAAAMLGAGGCAVEEAAGRLDLLPLLELPVAVLSAGQRRRAALARLLVSRRPIWLLDEPTAALDAASQEIVAGVLANHAAAGGMVIAATHLPIGAGFAELAFAPDGSFALKACK